MYKKIAWSLLFTAIGVIISVGALSSAIKEDDHQMYRVNSQEDVIKLFPKTVKAIEQLASESMAKTQLDIQALIELSADKRTFANTFKALDRISLSDFAIAANAIEIIEMVSPDKDLRDAAHNAIIKMQEFSVDYLGNNRQLYQALKEYVDGNATKDTLAVSDWYYINKTMDDFKRNGLDLPDDQLEKIKALNKELSALELNFSTNVAQDNSTITVAQDQLQGLESDFIESLKKTEDGQYILGCDYPTYMNVMQNCSVESTRKELFTAFNNRAYPINEPVLRDIIAKRHQLAVMLGFDTYADLDLSNQMVKTPEKAEQFIKELAAKSGVKAQQEFEQLVSDLPEGTTLTSDNKIKPWDFAFVANYYKKKHFDIDENVIAQYFPMEKTVKGLLDIYQQFFGLVFKEQSVQGAWHEDVKLVQVYKAHDNALLGYLLLDLYPRANKYSHACHVTIIPATYDEQGKAISGTSLVIANFPKSTESKPSLLKRSDVKTFFHEFGHALHALLGRTQIASLAGTHVKRDFVEMPSQMLEEWLSDADVLKQVSSHYQTGAPLPDDLIKRTLDLKNFDSGTFVQRQLMLSSLALEYYKAGEQKDMYKIYKNLSKTMRPMVAFEDADHMYASFGHLTGYGAKYYGYMWSKVFALDLFAQIKKHGLLNPEIGKKYVHHVIGKGGSDDPMVLLQSFLGREPNQQAFLQDLGLNA